MEYYCFLCSHKFYGENVNNNQEILAQTYGIYLHPYFSQELLTRQSQRFIFCTDCFAIAAKLENVNSQVNKCRILILQQVLTFSSKVGQRRRIHLTDEDENQNLNNEHYWNSDVSALAECCLVTEVEEMQVGTQRYEVAYQDANNQSTIVKKDDDLVSDVSHSIPRKLGIDSMGRNFDGGVTRQSTANDVVRHDKLSSIECLDVEQASHNGIWSAKTFLTGKTPSSDLQISGRTESKMNLANEMHITNLLENQYDCSVCSTHFSTLPELFNHTLEHSARHPMGSYSSPYRGSVVHPAAPHCINVSHSPFMDTHQWPNQLHKTTMGEVKKNFYPTSSALGTGQVNFGHPNPHNNTFYQKPNFVHTLPMTQRETSTLPLAQYSGSLPLPPPQCLTGLIPPPSNLIPPPRSLIPPPFLLPQYRYSCLPLPLIKNLGPLPSMHNQAIFPQPYFQSSTQQMQSYSAPKHDNMLNQVSDSNFLCSTNPLCSVTNTGSEGEALDLTKKRFKSQLPKLKHADKNSQMKQNLKHYLLMKQKPPINNFNNLQSKRKSTNPNKYYHQSKKHCTASDGPESTSHLYRMLGQSSTSQKNGSQSVNYNNLDYNNRPSQSWRYNGPNTLLRNAIDTQAVNM